MGVSKSLEQNFNITAIPGGPSVPCPKCGKKAFTIMDSDRFGQCWVCGEKIRSSSEFESKLDTDLFEITGEINDLCAAEFQQDANGRFPSLTGETAFKFCTDPAPQGRNHHPDIVRRLRWGAVPMGANFAEPFDRHIKTRTDIIESTQSELDAFRCGKVVSINSPKEKIATVEAKPRKGRPKKDKRLEELESLVNNLQAEISTLEEYRDKFCTVAKSAAGWRTIPYTDEFGRIGRIDFRFPKTGKENKKFQSFTAFPKKHLFHGLFACDGSNKFALCVEGPDDVAAIQSAFARASKDQEDIRLQNVVCVPSASQYSRNAAFSVFRQVILLFDGDAAGKAACEKLALERTFRVATLPGGFKDADEMFRLVGPADGIAKLREAIKSSAVQLIAISTVRDRIDLAMSRHGKEDARLDRERKRDAAKIFIDDVKNRFRILIDETNRAPHLFNPATCALAPVKSGNPQWQKIADAYGVNQSESLLTFLEAEIGAVAREISQTTEIHNDFFSQAVPDVDGKTKNIICYPCGDNQFYEISADAISLRKNGESEIYFTTNENAEKFVFDETAGIDLYREMILGSFNYDEGDIGAENYRILTDLLLCAPFVSHLFRTRQLVLFSADAGSGKTTSIRKFIQLHYGLSADVESLSEKIEDLATLASNRRIVILDNSDTAQSKMNDGVAVLSTGGRFSTREFYKQGVLFTQTPIAFLFFTSQGGFFSRPDIASRTIIIRLRPLPSFRPESSIIDELAKNRAKVLSAFIKRLQLILAALDATEPIASQFRLADLGSFVLRVARYEQWESSALDLLDALKVEQRRHSVEGDETTELISAWLQNGNENRHVTAGEMWSELCSLAVEKRQNFYYKHSAKSFGRYLTSHMPALRLYFDCEKSDYRSGGYFHYRFSSRKSAESDGVGQWLVESSDTVH